MSVQPVFCSFESRRAAEMCSLLERHGVTALSAPSMRELPIENNPDAISAIRRLLNNEFSIVVLMTGVGTEALFDVARSQDLYEPLLQALPRTSIVVRGPKPATVLAKVGLRYSCRAPEPNTWREVLTAMQDSGINLAGSQIAVQEYGLPNLRFYAALQERGATVTPVPVYRWGLPEDPEPLKQAIRETARGRVQMLLFTSANQVTNVLQMASELKLEDELRRVLQHDVMVASIGPTCTEALADQGFPVHAEASPPKMGQLVKAAVAAWQSRTTQTH